MEQKFIEFLKNSNKFIIDKNGKLHYSEVFSVFTHEINIENVDSLFDIIEDVVIYEPIISYCQSC